jgi:predicted nucleic acid-binding Zn ribbon protein
VTPSLRQQVLREWSPASVPDTPHRAAPLGQIVPGVLRGLGLEQRVYESQLFERWAEIVGPAAAAYTKPAGLRKGRLIVHVPHSAHIQSFRPILPEMLKRIQSHLGRTCVRDIQLRVGA